MDKRLALALLLALPAAARDRAETLRLFRENVYGETPKSVPVNVLRSSEGAFAGGPHRLRRLSLLLVGTGRTVDLALFLPAGPGPFPVIVGLDKCGNHAVTADPSVPETKSWVHPLCGRMGWARRGGEAAHWSVPLLLESGYGLAVVHESDIAPDDPAVPGPLIAKWAWGLSRVADALVKQPGVDPKRLIVYGHSRRGKAALWAAAQDERFALVAAHQTGTGGLALSKGKPWESVARVTKDYPHWFAPKFAQFGADPSKLPVDQDELLALLAPRPLIDTEGRFDLWASPDLAEEALRRAAPAYAASPASLSHQRRWTWHGMDEGYWRLILAFADARLK